MLYIPDAKIKPLVTHADALKWVRESFTLKETSVLPHKISLPFMEHNFMNTMPCMVPQLDVLGCKVVTRYEGRRPAVDGQLMLYRYSDGEFLALMDAFTITTMRTGAVAALAVETFARKGFESLAMMGLGNTGKATLECLAVLYGNKPLHIRLLQYKDHAEQVERSLAPRTNWKFTANPDPAALIDGADVTVSCVTFAGSNFAPDAAFAPGCLVVPVHTRGFQNCDLFFDKVFADDTAHVSGFKYFSSFRKFAEMPDVLAGRVPGRESEDERILSYNIGIALHDMVFAHHVCRLVGARA